MSQRLKLWCICVVVVFGFMVPGLALGQEAPASAAPAFKTEPVQAPEVNISQDEKPMTLEEIKKLLGPQNVCGAPCGFGQPKCYVSCGDAASCWHGYCIFL